MSSKSVSFHDLNGNQLFENDVVQCYYRWKDKRLSLVGRIVFVGDSPKILCGTQYYPINDFDFFALITSPANL